MHERASERDFQPLALRIALGAARGHRAETETLDQLLRQPIELRALQPVQLAVIADVLAAGEMRVQPARVR